MKNNSDKKFSYQQLPVSLKLIYTVLQVMCQKSYKLVKEAFEVKIALAFPGNVKV